MLPELQSYPGMPWKILPPGEHLATLKDLKDRFAWTEHRCNLYAGIERVAYILAGAGCSRLYLDGSYVTEKECPGDFDACWDIQDVDFQKLPEIIWNLKNGTCAQKLEYGGELFPNRIERGSQMLFSDFFQMEKHTGNKKGIVVIDLKIEFPGLENGGDK